MTSQPSLVKVFYDMSGRFFSKYSSVTHKVRLDEAEQYCIIEIPMTNENGFDIHIDVSAEEVTMHCGDFHNHYSIEGELSDFTNHLLGYLYDLLSPTMRLKVYTSSGKAYKWSLEGVENGEWNEEEVTGSLLYNYFGKKSEYILQNTTLEMRSEVYENYLATSKIAFHRSDSDA